MKSADVSRDLTGTSVERQLRPAAGTDEQYQGPDDPIHPRLRPLFTLPPFGFGGCSAHRGGATLSFLLFLLPSAPSVADERIQLIPVHVGLGIRTSLLWPRPGQKTKINQGKPSVARKGETSADRLKRKKIFRLSGVPRGPRSRFVCCRSK
jgi:hypothetical protein